MEGGRTFQNAGRILSDSGAVNVRTNWRIPTPSGKPPRLRGLGLNRRKRSEGGESRRNERTLRNDHPLKEEKEKERKEEDRREEGEKKEEEQERKKWKTGGQGWVRRKLCIVITKERGRKDRL